MPRHGRARLRHGRGDTDLTDSLGFVSHSIDLNLFVCFLLCIYDYCTIKQCSYVTRSTEMRNKSGHVKSGKSTSKSIGDGFALKC